MLFIQKKIVLQKYAVHKKCCSQKMLFMVNFYAVHTKKFCCAKKKKKKNAVHEKCCSRKF